MRTGEWDTVKNVESAVLGLELIQEWEQRFELEDR